MNSLLTLLIGVAAGAYFDKEVKDIVPILDRDATPAPAILPPREG